MALSLASVPRPEQAEGDRNTICCLRVRPQTKDQHHFLKNLSVPCREATELKPFDLKMLHLRKTLFMHGVGSVVARHSPNSQMEEQMSNYLSMH